MSGLGSISIVLAALLGSSVAFSQNLRPAQSDDSFLVTIFSAGAAATSLMYTIEQNSIVEARSGPNPHVTEKPMKLSAPGTLTGSILQGTLPGDVIRLQYSVRSAVELAMTQEELMGDLAWWREYRLQLMGRESKLTRDIFMVKADHHQLNTPDSELTLPPKEMARLNEMRKQFAENARLFSDLEMRFDATREELRRVQTAIAGLAKNEMPQMSKPMFVVRHIGARRSDSALGRFFQQQFALRETANASPYAPAVRELWQRVYVEKTMMPNQSLARLAALKAKGGAAAFAASLALMSEEMFFGYFGRKVTNDLNGHYAPEMKSGH